MTPNSPNFVFKEYEIGQLSKDQQFNTLLKSKKNTYSAKNILNNFDLNGMPILFLPAPNRVLS